MSEFIPFYYENECVSILNDVLHNPAIAFPAMSSIFDVNPTHVTLFSARSRGVCALRMRGGPWL